MLPLSHTYAFICGVLGPLGAGETVILNDKLVKFLKNINKYKPAMMFTVPMVLERIKRVILDNVEKKGKTETFERAVKVSRFLCKMGVDRRRRIFREILSELGDVRTIIAGGAPLKEELIMFFNDIGIKVLNGYGISECSPLVSVVSNRGKRRTINNSVGKCISCCYVKIDSEMPGKEGEIMVRGDNVMLGYYNRPQETQDVIKDGWLKTGDVGKVDEDGNLYIKGRIKCNYYGQRENVYPEEIEELLMENREIEEVQVYLNTECKITAEIYVGSENSISEEEIERCIHKANNELPLFSQVEKIVYRSEPFKKTTSQKIIRKRGGENESTVD